MLRVITPAATSDLTTLAAAKAEVEVTGSQHDQELADLIGQASRAIAQLTQHVWGLETVEQTERPAKPLDSVLLERQLDPAIASVVVDGDTLGNDEWELDGFQLFRLSADRRTAWFGRKIVVTYQAGYALPGSVPDDVERACLLAVAAWFAGRGRDPMLRSESTDGVVSASWIAGADMKALPPQSSALLRDGCRVRMRVH